MTVLGPSPGLTGTSICTVGGTYFDFVDPAGSVIDPGDIGHALSLLCRFTGHMGVRVVAPKFYSVAQHCVMVSRVLDGTEHAFAGLMHDAHEAYVGDVSSPLKGLCADYRAIEDIVEAAVAARFGLTTPWSDEVKAADLVMLATEKRDLTAASGHYWPLLDGVEPLAEPLYPMPTSVALEAWLERFDELCPVEFR
jgi:5'-deoxynucleotidase YfbR-like HD superfamily hydrolase